MLTKQNAAILHIIADIKGEMNAIDVVRCSPASPIDLIPLIKLN